MKLLETEQEKQISSFPFLVHVPCLLFSLRSVRAVAASQRLAVAGQRGLATQAAGWAAHKGPIRDYL